MKEKIPYQKLRQMEYERSKLEVGFQLVHRANQLLGIEEDRRLEGLRQKMRGR